MKTEKVLLRTHVGDTVHEVVNELAVERDDQGFEWVVKRGQRFRAFRVRGQLMSVDRLRVPQ